MALKEPGRFVEGVMLSVKPPRRCFGLCRRRWRWRSRKPKARKKNRRLQLMQQHHISELDAALKIAAEIQTLPPPA